MIGGKEYVRSEGGLGEGNGEGEKEGRGRMISNSDKMKSNTI